MKLNNKGFAITAVLYGLLILFIILVSSYLLVLSAKKDRVDTLVKDIEKNYIITKDKSLAHYVENLYLNNKNKVVTNNSIEYQYAESVNLMNDRLGGTTSDYDSGNVRYYGSNPNNYVDIGDRDGSGNRILYRIIGLFQNIELADGTKKDLIKVIRNESIGAYSWDNKTSGIGSSIDDSGSNDWSDSRLMMIMNPGYDIYNTSNPLKDTNGNIIYGYEGSLWWNSKNGTCYAGRENATMECDFTNTGLSSNVQNKIESVVWNLGGNSNIEVYSNKMYEQERGTKVYSGRPTTWEGKVALIYPSDYGYAADFNSCNETLRYYDSENNSYGCKNNDWLYESYKWLLTPSQTNSNTTTGINRVGYTGYGITANGYYVFPAFYLKSELKIIFGTGTENNPYVID